MQLSNLYSVYDRKAAYYLPVFNFRSNADAVRAFSDMVVSSDTQVSKYPADFDLCRVGVMDLETGSVTPVFPCDVIVNGLVAFQSVQVERGRYKRVLDNPQVDIEELIAEAP